MQPVRAIVGRIIRTRHRTEMVPVETRLLREVGGVKPGVCRLNPGAGRFAALLGGLAVLLVPAAGSADRRADLLLRHVQAAYRAAPALTAGVSMRMWHEG